mmetsp:Transcript_52593/g.140806  ORF Transcript_52593/g.140806 Transcript_52593/m.140806 type:complete len:282 (-) Transcript_52593:354-1199(-)
MRSKSDSSESSGPPVPDIRLRCHSFMALTMACRCSVLSTMRSRTSCSNCVLSSASCLERSRRSSSTLTVTSCRTSATALERASSSLRSAWDKSSISTLTWSFRSWHAFAASVTLLEVWSNRLLTVSNVLCCDLLILLPTSSCTIFANASRSPTSKASVRPLFATGEGEPALLARSRASNLLRTSSMSWPRFAVSSAKSDWSFLAMTRAASAFLQWSSAEALALETCLPCSTCKRRRSSSCLCSEAPPATRSEMESTCLCMATSWWAPGWGTGESSTPRSVP